MKNKILFFIILNLLNNIYSIGNIPDNSPIRKKNASLLNNEANDLKEVSIIDSHILVPFKVIFKIFKDERNIEYIFSNKLSIFDDEEKIDLSIGTYRIIKSINDNSIKEIRVYLNSFDNSIFTSLKPSLNGNYTYLNLYLFNKKEPLQGNIKIPLKIDELLYRNFNDIVELTKYQVNWDMILNINSEKFVSNYKMATQIHKKIKDIPYNKYGFTDKNCNIVNAMSHKQDENTKGLSDIGMIKYVLDGIYLGYKDNICIDYNEFINTYNNIIEQQDMNAIDYTGDTKDILSKDYFNIAKSLAFELQRTHETFDINLNYDSFNVKKVPYFNYYNKLGFKTKDIKQILYTKTYQKPDNIYIGTFKKAWDKNPSIYQSHKIVLIIPWFDKDKIFRVLAFDGKNEYDIDMLLNQNPNQFINILSLDTYNNFKLPELHF